MHQEMLNHLRCPVTGAVFTLQVIRQGEKFYEGKPVTIVEEGFLVSPENRCYPIIKGVPRLTIESFYGHHQYIEKQPANNTPSPPHVPENADDESLRQKKRTRESFSLEWNLFNYEKDKVWDAGSHELLQRFLTETNEMHSTIKGKRILDAGCGNGLLDQYIAAAGATVLGMDLSQSIEAAFHNNTQPNTWFIQADIHHPPLVPGSYDIVQVSGVLQHTPDPYKAFLAIEPMVKPGGKISLWLYHPRKNKIHRLFNYIRRYSSKLPVQWQYYIYLCTLFPISFIIKRIKGNTQNRREMMIDIMDWFSPPYRWEHEPHIPARWLQENGYTEIQITTCSLFGYNIIGIKKCQAHQAGNYLLSSLNAN